MTVLRRSPSLLLALLVMLATALPVAGYGHANAYHLRLSRLDPIACGRWIDIKADLTSNKGKPVKDVVVGFEFVSGNPKDVVDPTQATTDRHGHAYTRVKLDCGSTQHKLVAAVPGKATARIVLITHRPTPPPWHWHGFWWTAWSPVAVHRAYSHWVTSVGRAGR